MIWKYTNGFMQKKKKMKMSSAKSLQFCPGLSLARARTLFKNCPQMLYLEYYAYPVLPLIEVCTNIKSLITLCIAVVWAT